MDKGLIIPVVLFACITFGFTYVVKLLVGARVRVKMLQNCGSTELIQSIVQGEEQLRRMDSLRWGIVLTMEAIGFGLIQYAGWDTITPGVVALLIGSFGVGSLLFFLISRRLG
jgi:hypothetical protein